MALQKLYDGQEGAPTDHSLRRDPAPSGCGPQHPARDPELGGRYRDRVEAVRLLRSRDDRQLLSVVGVERVVDDDSLRTRLGILMGCT